jgi:pimeloyl-ACP methyl ester carboxylesterase
MTATVEKPAGTRSEIGAAGIAYDTAGDGGPPLLFLHGWCGDRSFFAPQFEHFSAAHRVVSVDLPGHGESKAPAAYTVESLGADVAALVRQLGLSRVVLVSHSFGSMVSLAVADQAPELVSAQIMVDPPPLSKEVWKDFAASLLPGFEGPASAESRRQFVQQMFLPTDDAALRGRIVESMCAVPNDVAIGTTKAMASYDPAAALRRSKAPVVVIASAVPTNSPAYLKDVNPDISTGQTVGVGHFLQLEVPEQVNPMIERFLLVSR